MPTKSESNLISKTFNYLQDVRRESKQITWPAFNFAIFQFFVVLVLSSTLTGLLYLIDIGLLKAINKLKEMVIR